jgi:hypothetical protein
MTIQIDGHPAEITETAPADAVAATETKDLPSEGGEDSFVDLAAMDSAGTDTEDPFADLAAGLDDGTDEEDPISALEALADLPDEEENKT